MSRVILLIEPDKVLAKVEVRALAEAGFEVRQVASTRAAIESADNQKPDLVVLEIELTGHNGIEFLYEFRSYRDWRGIPVVVNSYVPPSKFSASSKDLKLLGISKYLYKPKSSLGELVEAVRQELEV